MGQCVWNRILCISAPQTGKLGFIVPSERWHFANAGENGLPHQPEGWFAMTSFFVFSLFYRSVTLQRYVIANQCAHWCGNPFPAMRSIASAVGPIPSGAKIPICWTAE